MLVNLPPKYRKRPGRVKRTPPAAMNRITNVTLQEDQVTVDVFFTPGTVLTEVVSPAESFFINSDAGQTTGSAVTIISPTHFRLVVWDMVDSPATWEVDDPEVFTFATGVFSGPNAGDVVVAP